MSLNFAERDLVTPSRPMPRPAAKKTYVPMGAIRVVDRVIMETRPCWICGENLPGVFIVGIPDCEYCVCQWRPLHGTDIRKLEEKYPEYQIKTNEVEG